MSRGPDRRRGAVSALARVALPLLRRLDPERAHTLGLEALRAAGPWMPSPLHAPLGARASQGLRCFGLEFAHPLGLAAGFDKNGDFLDELGALGFSHVELGTVTPRPQAGNPRPRMFRIREHCALINRMGFNNKGVDHLVARLAASRYEGVRGVSIGKNADTPIERAQDDYLACLRKVYARADYIAINVSSPNTARLRELQSADGLERIVDALLLERDAQLRESGRRVPLLIKIAPDLDDRQIATLASITRDRGIDGVIATNTTIGRTGVDDASAAHEKGGLSGAPLHALSIRVIASLRAALGAGVPIIGVGGIVSAAAALETLRAGATLLQVYTGFAYRGPDLVSEIIEAVAARPRAAANDAAAAMQTGPVVRTTPTGDATTAGDLAANPVAATASPPSASSRR